MEVGKASEHSYKNVDGEDVCWVFESVLEVQKIDEVELKHGVAVFSELAWLDTED